MNELLLCENTNIKHVSNDDDIISGPHLINSDSIKLLKSKYLLLLPNIKSNTISLITFILLISNLFTQKESTITYESSSSHMV